MKSIFEELEYLKLRERLKTITPSNNAQWGVMSAAQMMKHCQYPLQVAMGKEKIVIKSNWLVKILFKKMMYSSKPYRKNGPTLSTFKVEDSRDFASEKEKLDLWIQELWYDRNNENRRSHPVFGEFTKEQWGVLQWKHLDHHFKQFGV
ncbi:DUF1569 domain-containing protein [Nonlabens antarcticus]|uniref:DUF1569 domain-containing protein n=1 Tax=Nonlabens antarcticus TaxID=392714 RepID=UPI001890C986|nr:DUF1569 domain-containing protein [Nonlabens antarcticus]